VGLAPGKRTAIQKRYGGVAASGRLPAKKKAPELTASATLVKWAEDDVAGSLKQIQIEVEAIEEYAEVIFELAANRSSGEAKAKKIEAEVRTAMASEWNAEFVSNMAFFFLSLPAGVSGIATVLNKGHQLVTGVKATAEAASAYQSLSRLGKVAHHADNVGKMVVAPVTAGWKTKTVVSHGSSGGSTAALLAGQQHLNRRVSLLSTTVQKLAMTSLRYHVKTCNGLYNRVADTSKRLEDQLAKAESMGRPHSEATVQAIDKVMQATGPILDAMSATGARLGALLAGFKVASQHNEGGALAKGKSSRGFFDMVYDWKVKGLTSDVRLLAIEATWYEPQRPEPTRPGRMPLLSVAPKKHVDRFYVVENLGIAAKKAGSTRYQMIMGVDWDGDPDPNTYLAYFLASGHAVVSPGAYHALTALFPSQTRTKDTGTTQYPALSLVKWGLRPQGGGSHAADIRSEGVTIKSFR